MRMRMVLWLVLAGCGAPANGAAVDEALAPPGTHPDAAAAVAASAACNAAAPFYWEIGDGSGAIVHGSVGTRLVGGAYSGESLIDIASASKWLFGAYVVEKFADDLSRADFVAMTLRSRWNNLQYKDCVSSTTVDDCLSTFQPSDLDHPTFQYNGGHFQHYAHVLGLGGDDAAALTRRYNQVLGFDAGRSFASPQLAAGLRATPNAYARFLRKILNGRLAIAAHLGENAVCTDKDVCPDDAGYSPAYPLDWHYSWGHWVEDDASGDGAFSSTGAFGFYPWIDKTQKYYGIVARYDLSKHAATDSAECGQAIRKAFLGE